MITIRIVAGLANQMHQYAFGRALSLERGDELFLDIDPFYYDTREYELGIFNIDAKIATYKEKPWYLKLRKNKLLDKIRYYIAFIGKKTNPNHLIENPKHPLVHKAMFDYNSKIATKVIKHPRSKLRGIHGQGTKIPVTQIIKFKYLDSYTLFYNRFIDSSHSVL